MRKQWKRNFSDSALNILKEALSGSECFKAGLVYEDNNWFLQIRSGDGKDELGSIFLERVSFKSSCSLRAVNDTVKVVATVDEKYFGRQ